MQHFMCYDAHNHLIGIVDAIDAEVAMLISVVADAATAYVLPAWIAIARTCR
jgi:hypothetical protein